MTTLVGEIKAAIDKQADAFGEFTADQRARLDELKADNDSLRDRIEELESRRKSPGRMGAPGGPDHEVWLDRKTGEKVPVLEHKHRLADLDGPQKKDAPTLGRWLRAVLTGKYAEDVELKALATTPDASGGYTVPEALASEFIDRLRARMVLSQAGARMVPMSTKTLSIASIVGDPAVGWHAENASDITPSKPTFGVAELSAKTIVGLTKLSLELSQDSLNVEEALIRALTQSVAVEIDRAGLGNTVANGPSGILSFTGRAKKTGIGALNANYDPFIDGLGLLMAANVPLERVGPIVIGPRAWRDLAKLKTGLSDDETTLARPWALTQPFLPTSAAEVGAGSPIEFTSTAYLGDWSDLLYGLRRQITIRLINEAFLSEKLQIGVLVYARVDFAAAREQSFCTLEGIVHAP